MPLVQQPLAPRAQRLIELLLAQAEEYALFFMTPERIITDWFAGAAQVFGFSAEEMVGESAMRLFNAEDIERGAADHEFELARSAGRAEDDRWHVRKDGTLFWGSGVTLALKDEAGEVVAFAKLMRNRTDVKTQTEAVENKAKAMADRAEQQDVFVGTLAHELRNPLAPLANAVEIIKRSSASADPMTTNALRIIDRQMATLGRLVDDILESTRATSGKLTLKLAVIDLRQPVQAAAESSRPRAEARGQKLEVILIPSPVYVCADAQRLEQVFVNLINNAIKFSGHDQTVLINLTTEGGDAIVRVEDSGVGMSAEILPRIFGLFTQEESSKGLSGGGLGLGLALVKDLVHLHGGTVQARSDGRDKGSIFTVRLPIYAATQT